jgi:biotin-dependent carboxylase-like uncharacterized protein
VIECTLTQYPIFIIDGGRRHAGASGVSESGPMDRAAFRLANHLLKQDRLTSALEVMGQCSFVAHTPMTITVTGGNAVITLTTSLNNTLSTRSYKPNQVISFRPGDTLTIGRLHQAMRLVVGIAGGLDVPTFFASRCGIMREKFGGLGQGKPILSSDSCAIGSYQPIANKGDSPPQCADQTSKYHAFNSPSTTITGVTEIDFVPNYQYAQFSGYARYLFTTQVMQVSQQSDRMGMRIHANQAIPSIIKHESQALALGVVQIPPNGQPIVMGPDRQTHGGYPVIGTVPEYALNKLVQLTPNESFLFTSVNIETAIAKYWMSLR